MSWTFSVTFRLNRKRRKAPAPAVADEPQPEGNNFTQAEHAHGYSAPPELHVGSNRQSIDDDKGGAYKARPVGFARN